MNSTSDESTASLLLYSLKNVDRNVTYEIGLREILLLLGGIVFVVGSLVLPVLCLCVMFCPQCREPEDAEGDEPAEFLLSTSLSSTAVELTEVVDADDG